MHRARTAHALTSMLEPRPTKSSHAHICKNDCLVQTCRRNILTFPSHTCLRRAFARSIALLSTDRNGRVPLEIAKAVENYEAAELLRVRSRSSSTINACKTLFIKKG